MSASARDDAQEAGARRGMSGPSRRSVLATGAAGLVLAAFPSAAARAATAVKADRAAALSGGTGQSALYLDTSYSFAERAADLVSRMTFAEKVFQLQTNNAPAIPRLGLQQYTYWSEGQHGINRLGADTAASSQGELNPAATSFPVNFAATMTWDPQLTYQSTTAVSDEARGFLDKSLFGTGQNNLGPSASDYGSLTFWAPNVNMDRDPRWGRTNESFGEDPFLTSVMAGAYVNGYQGQTMTGERMTPYLKVAATAKHYALNNDDDDRNTGSSDTTDANIRDYYTKQFASLVEDAHVAGVMTSYNAVNGTPQPANTYTVNELLQATYGFDGYTTSDCGAITDIYNAHDWAPPGWTTDGTTWTNSTSGVQISAAAGAQAYAVRAGTQLNCTGAPEMTPDNIQAAINLGLMSVGVLDSALTKLLTVRMETGEFDPASMVAYTKITKSVIQSSAHQALAESIAAQDVVLLQNGNVSGTSAPLLPLNPAKLNNVVIVGNLADIVTLGGYSGDPTLQVSAVQGITTALQAANPSATVTFDACDTSTTATTDAVVSAATQAAITAADLVIVFVGSDLNVADEGHDRTTLAMPGNLDSLITQVAALGNPRTAMVIQADGPYDIEDAQQDFPAIVFSGYNGESQGSALAQVLFGQQNPSGNLNFTWYAGDAQLPDMTNYGLTPSQTGGLGRTYMYFTGTPTYPFGYGLSYTTFKYSDIKVTPSSANADGTVSVGFAVTNTGTVAGATAAQLYAAPMFTVSGVELPLQQLVGFQKTPVLAPGQTQQILLTVAIPSLSRWDQTSLRQVVYDGPWEFRVGPDSATVAGSGTVQVHGQMTSQVRYVTVQPGQVIFKPGDTLTLTGKNPWITPDTNSTLEQPHADATGIIEAVNNDQSFVDLSSAGVSYSSSNPQVATVSSAGVVTMLAPGATTINVTVEKVTGSVPIVVQNVFTLQAPGYVRPDTTITATATYTNSGAKPVSGLAMSLAVPSGWAATATSATTISSVGPGQTVTATWTISIPSTASPGTQTELDASVAFTGAAGPYTEGAVAPVTVTSGATPEQVTPVITGLSPAAGTLQVLLNNPSDTPTSVSAINWTLGSNSGTASVSATVPAGSSATVDVPVPGITFATNYSFTVTSTISDGLTSEALSGHVTFMPVLYQELGSSWTVADVQNGPYVDLATTADGTWGSLDDSLPYGGASYLSGQVWFNWDTTNFYITANITEAAFSQTATGGNIWQGDSMQAAFTAGVPGSSAAVSDASTVGHYEYGAALTPDGSQLYRWFAASGGTGQVTDATVIVTRDDTTNTTLYQVALPWSTDLTSVQNVANTVFAISFMLNNVDSGVRNGYLEWGGGIGDNKNVNEFNMAQLMPSGS